MEEKNKQYFDKINSEVKEKRMFKEKNNNVCKYCGCNNPLIMTIEHKVPIIRGGDDSEKNKACSCYVCNQLKGALTDKEFKKYMKSLKILYGLYKVTVKIVDVNVDFNPEYYPDFGKIIVNPGPENHEKEKEQEKSKIRLEKDTTR